MKYYFISSFMILLVIFSLLGCSKMEESKRVNRYESTANSFRIFIRWGDYDRASSYINMREGKKPRELNAEQLKNIRVTSYENINEVAVGNPEKGIKEMIVVSALEYYNENTLRVEKIMYEQLWWYDPGAERWFLDGDLPDFGLAEQEAVRE